MRKTILQTPIIRRIFMLTKVALRLALGRIFLHKTITLSRIFPRKAAKISKVSFRKAMTVNRISLRKATKGSRIFLQTTKISKAA